jgi:hypothetical protein
MVWLGALLIAAGALGVIFLPEAPSAIQSNPALEPVGDFIITNANWLILAGFVLIVAQVFV